MLFLNFVASCRHNSMRMDRSPPNKPLCDLSAAFLICSAEVRLVFIEKVYAINAFTARASLTNCHVLIDQSSCFIQEGWSSCIDVVCMCMKWLMLGTSAGVLWFTLTHLSSFLHFILFHMSLSVQLSTHSFENMGTLYHLPCAYC